MPRPLVRRRSVFGIPPHPYLLRCRLRCDRDQMTSEFSGLFKGCPTIPRRPLWCGIYASRNICSRVVNAGCASSSFISDMSTALGNLGFPHPQNWSHDQFNEISKLQGPGLGSSTASPVPSTAQAVFFLLPGERPPHLTPIRNRPIPTPLLKWTVTTENALCASSTLCSDLGTQASATIPEWPANLNTV